MDDLQAVLIHLDGCAERSEEMSDAAARTVASWYTEGSDTAQMAFTSTGTIVDLGTGTIGGDGEMLYRRFTDGDLYSKSSPDNRRTLDFLGTYLLNRTERGPIEGWSSLWIR